MCLNNHYIFNKYIRKRILVPCGKCKECLQTKADARANRIIYNVSPDKVCLFVTLTYDNNSVPFVDVSQLEGLDLSNVIELPVYRNIKNPVQIDTVLLNGFTDDFDWRKVPHLRSHYKRLSKPFVGISYYKDLQNFLKRVRINLIRHEKVYTTLSYFACSEYGETFNRPHLHLGLFCKREVVNKVINSIMQSWPYCDRNRLCRSVEIARHPASYLASYVNSGTNLSSFFQVHGVKVKSSMSLGFGTSLPSFSLLEILKKTDQGNLTFNLQSQNNQRDVVTLPIPKYVISRFFPQFKGYSRVPPSSLANVLQRPSLLPTEVKNGEYTDDEIRAICVRLTNCFKRYRSEFLKYGLDNVSYEDYIRDYQRVYNCYYSTCLRLWYKNQMKDFQTPKIEYYDNIGELYYGKVHSYLSSMYDKEYILEHCNYNDFYSRRQNNEKKSLKYDRRLKQRKDVNLIYGYVADNF